jgi:hypothetical protein
MAGGQGGSDFLKYGVCHGTQIRGGEALALTSLSCLSLVPGSRGSLRKKTCFPSACVFHCHGRRARLFNAK